MKKSLNHIGISGCRQSKNILRSVQKDCAASARNSTTRPVTAYHFCSAAIRPELRVKGCGCISSTDHEGRQFWVVAAARSDSGRFIVQSDEMLTAFLELQAAIHRQFELV
jgi:hypothetical protein